jgi:hypothetical protein
VSGLNGGWWGERGGIKAPQFLITQRFLDSLLYSERNFLYVCAVGRITDMESQDSPAIMALVVKKMWLTGTTIVVV